MVVGIEIFFAFSTGGELVGLGVGFQVGFEVICVSDFEEDEGFVVLGQTGPVLKANVSMKFCASKVYSGVYSLPDTALDVMSVHARHGDNTILIKSNN